MSHTFKSCLTAARAIIAKGPVKFLYIVHCEGCKTKRADYGYSVVYGHELEDGEFEPAKYYDSIAAKVTESGIERDVILGGDPNA